ncbi:SAGA-associated factor 29 [Podospora fimiseda]|uniref:SAGA-associated factor 29 n=1 Tax=Podospora fimiseda TaxID=252190 RepID=A0AAN7BK18_9PEZI|nr:SAGA-associated factor 29 [Podospora fimiseda]
MSGRNRNSRGPNRNSGSTQGEEAQLWLQIKDDMRSMIEGVNSSNDQVRAIMGQDGYMANAGKNSKTTNADMAAEQNKLDNLLRSGVKGADMSKLQIDALIEHVTVLRALVKAREDSEAQATGSSGLGHGGRDRQRELLSSSQRSSSARGLGARDREKEREQRERERERKEERDSRDKDRDRDMKDSVYDFNGAEDSPVPSPVGGRVKLGGSLAGSDRSANRDSVPPRGDDRATPGKADSLPPDAGIGSAAAAQRARVLFYKGQDVVFKPKPSPDNPHPEWMLGKVQHVSGEGKSRRYKVQDADPDLAPEHRTEYRTSASSMIQISNVGTELPELEKGRTVLALYPDSTVFYKAEVMGTDASGKVSLRFDGETDEGNGSDVVLQTVDRRFVVEYRP